MAPYTFVHLGNIIMFKKTLLAIALAGSTMGIHAATQLAGDAFQIYGQAAGYGLVVTDQHADAENALGFVLESRIGFRGVVEFDNFAPNFLWQIESGDANNAPQSGQLGMRDTYIGLGFDNIGSIKLGRQHVAAYDYVDWPHTNPGLGNVFDWNNDIGADYEDRADNVLRYDSVVWNGFDIQATISGGGNGVDQLATSVAGAYTTDLFNVHAGYYARGEYDTNANEVPKFITNDNGEVILNPEYVEGGAQVTKAAINYSIIGGSLYLGDLSFTAAYKNMNVSATDSTESNSQDAVSATAQYMFNNGFLVKAGYSATSESKLGENDNDRAITGRLGYLLKDTYFYFDVRNYSMDDGDHRYTNYLLGAEYYF